MKIGGLGVGAMTLAMVATAGVSSDARAMCGCMVARRPPAPNEQNALLNKATVVVMMREGTHTVLSFQNDYFGPAEDFALVVPVPVVLREGDVRTLDPSLIDRLQAVAAPHMVELFEQPPCPQPMPRGIGIGAMSARGGGSSGGAPGGAMNDAAPPPVTVEAQFSEGEYDITILGANDSTALETWLRANGYHLPNGAAQHLRPYVEEGMKFFVARVDIGRLREVATRRRAQVARQQTWTQAGGLGQLISGPPVEDAPPTDASLGRFLSPLRIRYESERFQLPVRLGLINSVGEQDLVVHVLSPEGRFELANYGNRVVPTNLRVDGRAAHSFGRFYDAFFQTLSSRAPRRVFTEYAGPITGTASNPGCLGCARPELVDADLNALGEELLPGHGSTSRRASYTLTRLHYRYGRAGLPDDLVFRRAHSIAGGMENAANRRLGTRARRASRNDFRVRFVAQHRWRGAMTCARPQRGQYGARPWGGGSYGPASELAWPADRPIPLGAWVRDSVPALGIVRRRGR